jgi:hypothetical protein
MFIVLQHRITNPQTPFARVVRTCWTATARRKARAFCSSIRAETGTPSSACGRAIQSMSSATTRTQSWATRARIHTSRSMPRSPAGYQSSSLELPERYPRCWRARAPVRIHVLLTNQATPPRSAPKPAIPTQNRLATWPMIVEANFGGVNHQRLSGNSSLLTRLRFVLCRRRICVWVCNHECDLRLRRQPVPAVRQGSTAQRCPVLRARLTSGAPGYGALPIMRRLRRLRGAGTRSSTAA